MPEAIDRAGAWSGAPHSTAASKAALMQIVEGGVGRRRRHHLGAAAGQGVGQGQELRSGSPAARTRSGAGIGRAGDPGVAPCGRRSPGAGGTLPRRWRRGPAVRAQRGLGRVRRLGHGQVEGAGRPGRGLGPMAMTGRRRGAGGLPQGLGPAAAISGWSASRIAASSGKSVRAATAPAPDRAVIVRQPSASSPRHRAPIRSSVSATTRTRGSEPKIDSLPAPRPTRSRLLQGAADHSDAAAVAAQRR